MSKRPTHATVVAYLALFVAVGGTSYAAATVGSADIRNNSIRGKDVHTDTLTGREIKESKLAGVAGLDTYQVTASAVANGSEDSVSSRATCKRRDRAVGGGVQVNAEIPGAAVLRDGPLDRRTWAAAARIPVTSPGIERSIQVYAVCLRRPR